MNVTCKFKVVSKTEHHHDTQRQCDIALKPDYSGEDNKSWSKYTPNGAIRLSVTNPDAIDALELGAQYLITFEKA